MPSPKLAPVVLTDSERDALEALVRKRTASQSLAQRARIVLACAEEPGVSPLTRVAARRESSRAWIASGAPVTIKAFARRYGFDRYTAYEDLAAIGFPLPDSARRWAHRPPPRPARLAPPPRERSRTTTGS
jgi:hypothetical protein